MATARMGVWEANDVAIRRVTHGESIGAWQVIRYQVTRKAREWKVLQAVDGEGAARAWANWWDMAIKAHGLAGARDRFPAELIRCQALATITDPAELKAYLEREAELEDPVGTRNKREDRLGGDERGE